MMLLRYKNSRSRAGQRKSPRFQSANAASPLLHKTEIPQTKIDVTGFQSENNNVYRRVSNEGNMLMWESDNVSVGSFSSVSSIVNRNGSVTTDFEKRAFVSPLESIPSLHDGVSDSSTLSSKCFIPDSDNDFDSPIDATTLPSNALKTPILCAAAGLLSLKSSAESFHTEIRDNECVSVSSLSSADERSTTKSPQKIAPNANVSKAKAPTKSKKASPPTSSRKTKTSVATIGEPASAYSRIPSSVLNSPHIFKGGMRLAVPSDTKGRNVNALHRFVRKELLELYVLKGSMRVGLRCVHCGCHKDRSERACMSTFFPKSLEDLYRSVCTWQRIHFKACKKIPDDIVEKYWHLKESDRTRGKKSHWIQSAKSIGLSNIDKHRSGIVYCPAIAASQPLVEDDNDAANRHLNTMDYDSEEEIEAIAI